MRAAVVWTPRATASVLMGRSWTWAWSQQLGEPPLPTHRVIPSAVVRRGGGSWPLDRPVLIDLQGVDLGGVPLGSGPARPHPGSGGVQVPTSTGRDGDREDLDGHRAHYLLSTGRPGRRPPGTYISTVEVRDSPVGGRLQTTPARFLTSSPTTAACYSNTCRSLVKAWARISCRVARSARWSGAAALRPSSVTCTAAPRASAPSWRGSGGRARPAQTAVPVGDLVDRVARTRRACCGQGDGDGGGRRRPVRGRRPRGRGGRCARCAARRSGRATGSLVE